MRPIQFPTRHPQRDRVLSTIRDLQTQEALDPAVRDARTAECIDTYLKSKADADVVHKSNKLFLAALDTFPPPLRDRFDNSLLPAVQRRHPTFADAVALAQALNTEALAVERLMRWAQHSQKIAAAQLPPLREAFQGLIHEQEINDGMAFALADALSHEDLRTALTYYTGEAGRGFLSKLPQLIALELNTNVGPVGLLEPVLGTALRPEEAQSDPRLRKMQRILARCPHTMGGELGRKLAAEAAVQLFTDAEIDAALEYWESTASERINAVSEAFSAALKPRLQHSDYALRLDEIMRRLCKD